MTITNPEGGLTTWLHRASFGLSLIGLATSLYLAWEYARGGAIACPVAGTGCEEVRSSQFSSILGVPVPWLGIAFYVSFAVLEIVRPEFVRHQRMLMYMGLTFAATGILVSGWFTYLEAFVIGAWCFWCLVSAACAVSLFVLAVVLAVIQPQAGVPNET